MSDRSLTAAERALRAGRPAVARSFRHHRPRGPVCGRGHCHQCACVIDGRPALACQTTAPAAPPTRDRLRPLGRVGEAFPPWFWERRLLAPRPARGRYLQALRHLSSAPALGAPPAIEPVRLREVAVDVLHVGDASRADPGALVVDAADGATAFGVYPGQVVGVQRAGELLAVRCARLVLATGAYERLPAIAGNDLPGVLGLRAAEGYARAGALPPGARVVAWLRDDQHARLEALVAKAGLELVDAGAAPPTALHGRGRVEAATVDGQRVACDLVLVGVEAPAIELALQAGARGVLADGLPLLVAADLPGWVELRGAAARASADVPDHAVDDAAYACLCEDVRVGDVRAAVADGLAHPELVKRRTGALTGPCQGRLCASTVLGVLRGCGVEPRPTTARPLARPVTIAELAARA